MLPEAIKSVGEKNNFRDWKLLRSRVREERLKIFADQLLQTWKLIEIVDMAVVRSCNHAIDAVKKKLRLETRIPNFHCSLFCTYESFWTQPHIITTVSEIRSFFLHDAILIIFFISPFKWIFISWWVSAQNFGLSFWKKL